MHKKQTNQQATIPKTPSSQNLTMGKHTITKRRYSQQSKLLESTFFLFKHRNNTSFRPLVTSTPYEIEQLHSFNTDSPHSIMRYQRPLLTPPVFCSTPKQTRHQPILSSARRKLPVVISQRRLQFTTNNSNNESKRMTIKNVKIWLL